VPFHIVGLKCVHCGSYNTCNDSEPTGATAAAQSASSTDDHPHDGDGDDKNT